jgi:hypothetical protein
MKKCLLHCAASRYWFILFGEIKLFELFEMLGVIFRFMQEFGLFRLLTQRELMIFLKKNVVMKLLTLIISVIV